MSLCLGLEVIKFMGFTYMIVKVLAFKMPIGVNKFIAAQMQCVVFTLRTGFLND